MVGSKEKEQKWITDIQAGGEIRDKAIKEVYETYREPCLRFFRSRSKKLDSFDDLYQNTMLEVFKKQLKGVNNPSSLKSYIRSIFYNKFKDDLRKWGKEKDNKPLEELPPQHPIVGNSEEQKEPHDPALILRIKKVQSLLWQYVGHPCDQIIRLGKDGFTQQEIADEIGLKLQTIKNNASNCKEKAKEFFKEHPNYLRLLRNFQN